MSEARDQSREALKAQLLGNPAIRRFIRGFETFAQVFQAATNEEKAVIFNRMREVFPQNTVLEDDDHERAIVKTESNLFYEKIFDKISAGEPFSAESFVDELLGFTNLSTVLLKYHGAKRELSARNQQELVVNELISATRCDGVLSVQLRAAPVGDMAEVVQKTKEAFVELADILNGNEFGLDLSDIKTISLVSWLLAPVFDKKIIEKIFGEGLEFADEDVIREDVRGSQNSALVYNDKSLERYLKTGQMPEVRGLIFSREEFIKRFGSKSK